MTTATPDHQLVADLRRLRAGQLSGPDFLAKYRARRSSVLEIIFGNLHHYAADADIRAKDPEYAKMQNDELDRLIGLVKRGASEAELGRITFLGRSE